MIAFLTGILSPITDSLGISAADLASYLERAQGCILAGVIALALLLSMLIGAHFRPRGKRMVFRLQSVLAFVLAVTIIVNLACYQQFQSEISTFLQGSAAVSEDISARSDKTSLKIAEEGIVLVQNNNELLPLSDQVTALNVFGWASTSPIFGGVGSGASDGSSAVGILESLERAGYAVNQDLAELYSAYAAERPAITALQTQDWTLPEVPMEHYTAELMNSARHFSDTALIVLGRSGGEGADLPTDMKAVIDGTWDVSGEVSVTPDKYHYTSGIYHNNSADYDDFDTGDHYLRLSNTEKKLVDLVCANFEKVIVVINANNVMELGWIRDYPQIQAALLVPGTGNAGMEALGRILKGTVNPSGRTADTYPLDLTSSPEFASFGQFSYTNTRDLQSRIAAADASYEGALSFVQYREGIYVGYRFWETAAEEGLFAYEDAVLYPFGYGLSYTSFEQRMQDWHETAEEVSFSVAVKNIGKTAGRDVVEVYFTPPYTNGGIEKPAVSLLAYGKTQLLSPGETETLGFTISKEEMASYDDLCLKTAQGGYVLEQGEYTVSLRADAHHVLDSKTFTVKEDVLYDAEGRATDQQPAVNLFDAVRGENAYLSRKDHFANLDEIKSSMTAEARLLTDARIAEVAANTVAGYDGTLQNQEEDVKPELNADNGLTLTDMIGKDFADPAWDSLLAQMSIKEMISLVSAGGWHTEEIKSIGKTATSDSDGPAGMNNLITKAQGTAFPVEVLMAQTWDQSLAYEVGQAIGGEFAGVNAYGWYAPAVNTHRSAFGGRNYEYFSEDPLLSGAFAAEEIRGAQSLGLYTYTKHFALNEQETNRETILLTWAGEQSIREIYLKPFEIAVKKGGSKAMMSAFNWLGTTPAMANSALLQDVLRGEWGFTGMVISDYDGPYGFMITENAVRNGNDLMLSMSAKKPEIKDRSATITLALKAACKNILYTVVNSGNYVDPEAFADEFGTQVVLGSVSSGMNNMDRLFLTVDGIILAVLILIEAILMIHCKKKRG